MSLAWAELVLSASLFGAGSLYDACRLPDALVPSLRARCSRIDLPGQVRAVLQPAET
ncbi:hypothetical protein ACFV2N_16945 [Streptomyces sp. NPDC059680]|uniref:hypothetical protein n=1 Tax=Streptomyces sp. NPDC059680 TaxID=3346904 RepID=UPI0036C0BF35